MSVFGLVSAVAGFVKVRYLVDKAVIDNSIFRCHYRITSALLFVCCIIVTANNLIGKLSSLFTVYIQIILNMTFCNNIGDPINCINDGAIPTHVINTYCWITYTYTLPGMHGQPVGTHVASSGLGNEYGQERTFHSYYQWVPFCLFFQVNVYFKILLSF